MYTSNLETNTIRPNRKGYVALMSVIVLGAIGTAITVTLLVQGVLSSKTNLAVLHKHQSRMAATSWAEEALQLILDTGIDSGGAAMSVGSSTCTYVISSTSSENILVHATGQSADAISKISVYLASSTPRIKLSSWQEVGDF